MRSPLDVVPPVPDLLQHLALPLIDESRITTTQTPSNEELPMYPSESDEPPAATLYYELDPLTLSLQMDRIVTMRIDVQAAPSADGTNEWPSLWNVRVAMDLPRWVTITSSDRPRDDHAWILNDLLPGASDSLVLRLLVSAAVAVPRQGHLELGRLKVLADRANDNTMLGLRMQVRIPIEDENRSLHRMAPMEPN